MSKFDYDIAIIGGGAAGLTVASGAGQLGAKTLLIEREPFLGGDCLHFGCVPSKTLIKTAKVYHQIKTAERYGLPAVDPGKVDFSQVAQRIKRVIDHIQVHDSVERFNSLGAEIAFGKAQFVDEHQVVLDGKKISAAKWVIATGSSPSVPVIPGIDTVNYLTNKDVFSLDKLPDSLIVVGGGAIAMEMAQAFNRLGSKVTVIQRSGQILSKEDADMADLVQKAMEEEGITFYLNTTLQNISETSDGRKIVEFSNGESHRLEAEETFLALGRKVNTENLGLENCGIEYSPKGIVVDEKLRTSQKHIYAAGDVIGGYQFTHAAGYEGGIVLSNSILNFPRKVNYTWMPWCTYTHPELASVGLNEKRARDAGLEYSVWTEKFADNDRGYAEHETTGFIKLIMGANSKPLGVQILGGPAGDLLAQWVAVLNGKVKLSNMAGAILPYPTYAEINKRVVGSIYSEKLFSDKVRKVLRFFFNYRGEGKV